MKPSRTDTLPKGAEWMYELKYDGYRAFLEWDGSTARLTSKNDHPLNAQFPEIIKSAEDCFSSDTSFSLDGELIVFENWGKADFYTLQSRFRRRGNAVIQKLAKTRPAAFLGFDCLQIKGKAVTSLPWKERKNQLKSLFKQAALPLTPEPHADQRIQFLPACAELPKKIEQTRIYCSEGIVAKHIDSAYEKGRTSHWLKFKTPYKGTCFITAYDPANDYFHLGVFQQEEVKGIGKCAHGLTDKEQSALVETIKKNGTWDPSLKVYTIEPSIVVETAYTTRKKEELREPRFRRILFQTPPSFCTWENWQTEALRFPEDVDITHPEKPLWPDARLQKLDFLQYVRQIAPYVLPFLQNRALTVIRFPHGMMEDGFFQKDCPAYAPSFVDTKTLDDTDYIVCNKLETLLWLANQLAIEWHIPFKRVTTDGVDEVVFDLDPPDAAHFPLAVDGALALKALLDSFEIEAFVKFSGNKGLQVNIPLPENTFTWEDTRVFTKAVGHYLTAEHGALFTTERLKKNRGQKLYIDIPQHAEGKTIIAPYSMRGKEEPLIACPLFWDEVSPSLDRSIFTHEYVLERTALHGCPFLDQNGERNRQPFERLLQTIRHSAT
ncbi:DNA ligase D [Salibacterium aidingense]|uniref:DNA ligase D n=1 Tax=Salibacterium aidingense TaxID=384933 RepID=UPI0004221FF7|nr:DNA ligase D [Salibacterium aidingense]